jgi:mRNA-degrading endonuclease RelE of RelBE toxin-antitoxin system
MVADPFRGDVLKLEGDENRYRRRVGNYRIFFRVDRAARSAGISAIVRRTSTTC